MRGERMVNDKYSKRVNVLYRQKREDEGVSEIRHVMNRKGNKERDGFL